MKEANKSALIINTPEKCFDCPVHQFLEGDKDEGYPDVMFCNGENWRKPVTHTPILDFTKRPDWCPLKPLPEMKTEYLNKDDVLELIMHYCPDDDGSCSNIGDTRDLLDEIEALPSVIFSGEAA